jgi:hypothetical protein
MTSNGPRDLSGLYHLHLGIIFLYGHYHVLHIPTGRSIVAARRQSDARRALQALMDAVIDFSFDTYAIPGTPGYLKYELSEVQTRHVLTGLIKKGVKLVEASDLGPANCAATVGRGSTIPHTNCRRIIATKGTPPSKPTQPVTIDELAKMMGMPASSTMQPGPYS